MNLWDIGKSNDLEKDKFISRFFGIFNESIADIYFKSPFSKYKNIGRPTIKINDERYTLDFTLKHNESEKLYICEMKSEMQYRNYMRLELENIEQIKSFTKKAFKYFLDIANNSKKYKIEVNKKTIKVDGIIMLWGKITNDSNKLNEFRKTFNVYDILSLENMINEMIKNNYSDYYQFINKKNDWVNEFFFKITKGENV
jgi:Lhr-like helicase